MAGFGWNSPLNNFNGNNYGMPQMTQTVMQNCYMPIQVRDREEARTYPVAANTTVSLISANFDFLWIKSTNASGGNGRGRKQYHVAGGLE